MMKKILITGIGGFVGRHFVDYLQNSPREFEIHGIARSKPQGMFYSDQLSHNIKIHHHQADVTDTARIQSVINEVQPDQILHLAAQSSVAESWISPAPSFMNNISGFLNIIEAVRQGSCTPRILSIGSSEQYGRINENDLPLAEDHPLNPDNPYAAGRVAQEHLAMVYHDGYGLDICCTRSFNHCGPGQSDRFVASSIALQFARIAQGRQDKTIHIGNGSIVRDFLDVRDVIRAYTLLLEKGVSGEVYNICSGRGYSIRELVTLLADKRKTKVQIVEETQKMRPRDNPSIIGNNAKVRAAVNWQPEIPLDTSLDEMVTFWEKQG
jgi:GDP-4-dehydro-6-deoxy-D-mannose reductase